MKVIVTKQGFYYWLHIENASMQRILVTGDGYTGITQRAEAEAAASAIRGGISGAVVVWECDERAVVAEAA